MENASKALLMAGGVLIAIIVISIGVFLFLSYGEIGSNYEETTATNEVMKYNTNFTKFLGRQDITIQEIVSTISFADNNEIRAGVVTEVYIGSSKKNRLNKKDYDKYITELITNNSGKLYELKAINSTDYDQTTGKIKKVTFTEI